MKENKVLSVIIIILLIVVIVLLVTGRNSKVSYDPHNPTPTPSPTPNPNPEPNPSPEPEPTPIPSPEPKKDECFKISGYDCDAYKNGWIIAFKKENNLTDSAFNNYVSIQSSFIEKEGTNYEFSVFYIVKKSWVEVARTDSMFLYNSDRSHIYIPSEWLLERSSETRGRTGLSTMHLNDTLVFSTKESALNYFVNKYNLENTNVSIGNQSFQYFWDGETGTSSLFVGEGGEPIVSIMGTININENQCFMGELGLVSKETVYKTAPCVIYN